MLTSINRLVLVYFIRPFITAFLVCIFVFLIRNLIIHFSDIFGKDMSLSLYREIFTNFSLISIPYILPFCSVYASLICFGSLNQFNEIIAIRASGISPRNTYILLTITVILISIGGYIYHTKFLYKVNFNAYSSLVKSHYNLSFHIKENQFYTGFPGFTILAKNVTFEEDTTFLKNVLLYKTGEGGKMVYTSNKGKIYNFDQSELAVVELINGHMYKEYERDSLEHMRLNYNTTKLFISLTDNKNYQRELKDLRNDPLMKSQYELKKAITSTKHDVDILKKIIDESAVPNGVFNNERLPAFMESVDEEEKNNYLKIINDVDYNLKEIVFQSLVSASINKKERQIIKLQMESYRKYLFAMANIIFYLLGFVISLKIKKGEIGLSILISTVVYVFFFISCEFFETLAQNAKVSPFWGAFLPLFVLLIPNILPKAKD